MAFQLESVQTTLTALYAARADLLSGKVSSYTLGDRTFTLLDLEALDRRIASYEARYVASKPIYADMSGIAHMPFFPEG